MLNLFSKLKFLLRKPKVIIITGSGRDCAAEAIFQVLNSHFKIGKEVLIFETELKDTEEFKFFAKHSSLPILVVTQIGDIPPDKNFFAGDRERTFKIRELAKTLPIQGHLILNFDDETVREIKDETNLKELTFGLQDYNSPTTSSRSPLGERAPRADFWASDIKLNSGTNFKINYKGRVVPIWLEEVFGKEQIYSALAAVAVGTIFDLNLVEISQALQNFQTSDIMQKV